MGKIQDNKINNSLNEPEILFLNALGIFFSRGGLKNSSGKIWGVLYLSNKPLDAHTLVKETGLSTGAVSLALAELLDIEIIEKVALSDERRFFYVAKDELWQVARNIFMKKSRSYILEPLKVARDAQMKMAEAFKNIDSPLKNEKLDRVSHLIESGEFAVEFLDAVVRRTKIEMKAAKKWLSVSEKLAGDSINRIRKRIKSSS
ncbi:MAG: hypothetical protein JXR91_16245 [Deltaproteobacteria bacterium]|nr:hypothetical protein [Deltaproteobacteria bacterium]